MMYGRTETVLCRDYQELGRRAGADVGAILRGLLQSQAEVRIVFAAAESQTTFVQALAREPGVEWRRVVCFNMDDFWEPRMDPACSCGAHTRRLLYEVVGPKAWHQIRFNAPDPQAEAERFSDLLRESWPLDITCQGIGESGHIALNEPGAAKFDDPELVRVVEVAEESKAQLRKDPNFRALGAIPAKGITMTLPALLAARHVFTMVPLGNKRAIVARVLAATRPTEEIPATILQTRPGKLYLDRDSAPDFVT